MVLAVDVGGTFTDAVLLGGDGVVSAKAPSTPGDQSVGVLAAVDAVLERSQSSAAEVTRFVHGMTVGTNALLEGKVATTALLATRGFTDIEELGRQARAELYRLCAGHPPPLVPPPRRIAVHERTGPDGVIEPLDEARLLADAASVVEGEGIDVKGVRGESVEGESAEGESVEGEPVEVESAEGESVEGEAVEVEGVEGRRLDGGRIEGKRVEAAAVCLLWGFRHREHERRIAELLAERHPDLHVSTSHETAGVFREYERCATTIVDAALSPLLRRYLERLSERARAAGLPPLEVMLSGGGVADAATAARHGSWTVLSGPAGGAVGAARMAARADAPDAVCLDMGGTSCDVCVAEAGGVRQSGGRSVGGRALALPMVDVTTVGAGGGSVAWEDAGGALRVGPRSAGADPGPACYGRGGGEPTVTDANLVLGYLDAGSPLAGGVTLDRAAAERAVAALGERIGLDTDAAAAGIVRVASVEMARAVRVATVERGIDPRPLALVAFGGAGPLHATAIARELGMSRVIVPSSSGVLSALGLAVSERRRDLVESVLAAAGELAGDRIAELVERQAARGRAELGAPDAAIRCGYDLRYAGQSFELTVPGEPAPDPGDLRRSFEALHEERYGYSDRDAELELVTIRVAVVVPGPELASLAADQDAGSAGSRRAWFDGERLEAAVIRGAPAEPIAGPAIVELPEATVVVPPGWGASADTADRTFVLELR